MLHRLHVAKIQDQGNRFNLITKDSFGWADEGCMGIS